MSDTTHDPAATRAQVEKALSRYPSLADRIIRGLLIALHGRGIITIDEINERARARIAKKRETEPVASSDNVAQVRRWDDVERRFIQEITLQQAAESLTPEEIRDVVSLIRRRDEAQTLEEIANLSSVSFRLLAEKVRKYSNLPVIQTHLPMQETVGVRVALIRHFISDQLEFIGVAKRHLRIRDFTYLIDRVIGDDSGMGKIGGKAAGMLLAHRIIERARKGDRSAPQMPIVIPESFYLRSDVIERFLEINGLVELQSHKYKNLEEIRNEYPLLVEMFKNGEFPEPEKTQLGEFLERVGKHPLIVRSSSLLEDRFGTAFAGKYRSVFVANQGTVEENLSELLGAITEVYASLLHPDPISYRQRHTLLDYDENMAVLIQKVVGTRYRHYFCPLWAGVAFSRNEYRWSPRIRREDGLARMVFGIGTRAVDRVSSDYPRMIALGLPTLRPEASTEELVRYSQRFVDVINMDDNRFETIPVSEMITDEPLAGLDGVVEILKDGELVRPMGSRIGGSTGRFVITFDRFAKESPYPGVLKWILQQLEKAYKCPVDVEFAYDG
ncbi:MAG: PEP/pyruvate-binding domain-containing protein, partial [Acidobacteriota bacterium]|nr:PEP/pyruvate-binding domain-containing protein [Acidobacteriota bacterium]